VSLVVKFAVCGALSGRAWLGRGILLIGWRDRPCRRLSHHFDSANRRSCVAQAQLRVGADIFSVGINRWCGTGLVMPAGIPILK
jgi:hypothetical protein